MAAICEKCLIEIHSEIFEKDGAAWMIKECPTHGKSLHCIEPDIEFFHIALQQEPIASKRAVWDAQFSTTALDVTRRCNVQCPHCYVEPDNLAADAAREHLVDLAKSAKRSNSIILMGAEPTVRDDLQLLIGDIKRETGKTVGIYTNAIRLADADYANQLAAAGLDYACVSLHTPDYLPNPRLFDFKIQGIGNLKRAGVRIHHISFSLRSIDELDGVLGDAIALRPIAEHIRIRSPQKIGVCKDEPMPLSELYREVCDRLTSAGHVVDLIMSDNTPYHVNIRVDGFQLIRLIRWPTLATADLDALRCPPYALFDKKSGEINLVLSFLMQEARRNMARSAVRRHQSSAPAN